MAKHNPIRHDLLAVGAVLALPIVEWWDDRKPWERVAAISKAVIILGCAAAVVFLGGCKTQPQPETPGIERGLSFQAVTR